MGVLHRCLAVVGLALLLADFPGAPFSSGLETQGEQADSGDAEADEALRIAEQVTGEVEGPTAGPSTSALLQNQKANLAAPPAPAEPPEQAAPAAASADSAVAVDAENAHIAASTAKEAAHIANKVAVHSVRLAEHAKSALKNANDALHKARVETAGLSNDQKRSLKVAEAKLKAATKDAEYGQVKNAKYVKADVENRKLQKLEDRMSQIKETEQRKQKGKAKVTKVKNNELEAMRKEIKQLREQLKKKEGQTSDDEEVLKELQQQIEEMEAAEKKEDRTDAKSHDELKAEIEKLRQGIGDMEDAEEAPAPKKVKDDAEGADDEEDDERQPPRAPRRMTRPRRRANTEADDEEDRMETGEASPVEQRGIDIDTAMPYGDLEPFGREDTAQELTENSISESNAMVDQLERAEVAEEKRAVFRALTRLRGAAITSFDSIARAQTGQIDEYNKMHQWRRTHPLHHLANEESDVSKWAFPENADF